MQDEGHAIFSHSIDHDYNKYFLGATEIQGWLETSLTQLKKAFGITAAIFRPPAGVLTPPLVAAASKLNLRLVLWNHRFFDTRFQWSIAKANRSLSRMKAGDIILLHDFQNPQHHQQFLITLNHYLSEIRRKNLICAVLR